MPTFQSFWRRYISAGVEEDTPPNRRSKIYITKCSSLCLILLGPIFTVLNLWQGYLQLALVNLTSTLLGLTCLFLLRKRIIRPAALLLIIGGGIIYFYSGLIFHNGTEYSLLLGMLGGTFMFESFFLRLFLAVFNGMGFLVIKIMYHGPTGLDQFPLSRYTVNILILLVSYYFILEIVRTVDRNYQRVVEEKNTALAESRRKLDEERAELIARTSQLQIANRAKEKLFSILAHDLRGPIGSLKSSLDLVSTRDLTETDFHSMTADFKVGVDRVYECLDNLLLWSAGQLREIKPIFTEVSLESTAQDSVELLADMANYKGITVCNSIPAEARVWADETQISYVVYCEKNEQDGYGCSWIYRSADEGRTWTQIQPAGDDIPPEYQHETWREGKPTFASKKAWIRMAAYEKDKPKNPTAFSPYLSG